MFYVMVAVAMALPMIGCDDGASSGGEVATQDGERYVTKPGVVVIDVGGDISQEKKEQIGSALKMLEGTHSFTFDLSRAYGDLVVGLDEGISTSEQVLKAVQELVPEAKLRR
jgi:hypothetical protein